MRIKWDNLGSLCQTICDRQAGVFCWIEDDDGKVRAGCSPSGAIDPTTQDGSSGGAATTQDGASVGAPIVRVPIAAGGSLVATLCAQGHPCSERIEHIATLCKREIDQQTTLRDMAGATARLWRQTNAMLRMAGATQLTLDPGSTVGGIIAAIKKSTCFAHCVAVVRLPADDDYTRMGDAATGRISAELLAPLGIVGKEVSLTTDLDLDEAATGACRQASGFEGESAVVRIATEVEHYGYLLAEFPADSPPSSEDCKLLAAGAQILSIGVANGHTLRRAKEATRRQVESKLYETLAKTVPVGILRIDESGEKVTYVNEQWRAITALDSSGDIAAAWVAAIHDEDRQGVLHAWKQAVETQQPFRMQYRIIRPDGEERWVLGQAAADVDAEGRLRGYVGSITDVTEQKRAEEEKERLESQLRQSQKMESLGVMAGGIAHDFNNILGAIIGSAELAIGKVDPESRLHRNLERILTGANRAKELVRQILAFSRQQTSEGQATDLAAVAEEAMTLARASIPTTIELVSDIEPGCPPVPADGTQLHQIIMNLCTNAYHAIGKRNGTITVGVHSNEFGDDFAQAGVPKPGRYVHLSVSDTGCGMDEETKNKIFDPFFTTKEVGKGTGLGLSVVHGIVTKSGGAISVDSKPGKGTTFHIYLPACEEACNETEKVEDTVVGGSGRVMLVDDETDLLATAGEILEELGYQVTAFSSSIEALEAFRAAPDGYDVVVSDQTMPEMTGAEMYEKMAAVRPDVRFIVATGFSDTLDPSGARKMGLAGFVPKPYRPRDLAKSIARALNQA